MCAQAADEIQNGQRLDIDLSSGLITNRVTSKTLKAEPFSEKTLEILSAGGIIQLIKKEILQGVNVRVAAKIEAATHFLLAWHGRAFLNSASGILLTPRNKGFRAA